MAVTNGLHANSTSVNVHVPYAFEYADQTAREAATGFVVADVGKFARQLDDNSIWMLTDDSPATWVAVGSAGSGAPTDAEYVASAANGTLSAEVVIPGLAGSADRAGIGGAGVSYEFDSGASPLTWSAAVDTEDVDTTVKSHLYIQDNGAAETLGTYSWSPAGAFDIRCKLSMGSEVGVSASIVACSLIVGDSAMNNRVLISLEYLGSADNYRVTAYTYASSTYTQRGATNVVGTNFIYLRIVRDGSNNNSMYFSADGITWMLVATQALTYTAAKAGLRLVASSLVTNVAVDWIRSDV